MAWDWLIERTGKLRSIRCVEYPEFQTGISGRMESAPGFHCMPLLAGRRVAHSLKGQCHPIWQLYKKREGVFASIEFQAGLFCVWMSAVFSVSYCFRFYHFQNVFFKNFVVAISQGTTIKRRNLWSCFPAKIRSSLSMLVHMSSLLSEFRNTTMKFHNATFVLHNAKVFLSKHFHLLR